jgi:hypothetical protein
VTKLEETRGTKVGDVVAWFGGDDIFPAAFHHHANQAYWHTINCLLRFSGASVDGVSDELIGIVEYWRTIESLIALLYSVALRESEAGLRPHAQRLDPVARPDAIQKWAAIARWFSAATESAPSDVTGRLTELRDFRNSFEHSSRTDERTRSHSRLCESPVDANLFDLMEALAICISCCHYLRNVLPGSDLMPQVVVVPPDKSFFFEQLDVVGDELVVPLLDVALDSRGMSTNFAFYEASAPLAGQAQIAVAFLIQHRDAHELAEPTQRAAAWAALQAYGEHHPRKPLHDAFGLPGYSANPG